MNKESIILFYLYFITESNLGTNEWEPNYLKWRSYGESIGCKSYEEAMDEIKEFRLKYKLKDGYLKKAFKWIKHLGK